MITRTCDTCGYVGHYSTPALAEHHFGRHSCALHAQTRDRRAARAARDLLDGEARPCLHTRGHHEHGTAQRYLLDACRCRPCRLAKRAVDQQWRRESAYGRRRLVDAEPARQHILDLAAAGMGTRSIAAAAGVCTSALQRIIYGRPTPTDPANRRPPARKIDRDLAAAILAVELRLRPGARVASHGSSRRLQALVAIGWSQTQLAARLGVEAQNLTALMHGRRQTTQGRADAVRALYEELWNQRPPQDTQHQRSSYQRSVSYAAARGWAVPMAWDDDDLDDPAGRPHIARGQESAARHRPEDVEQLLDAGQPAVEIARQVHTAPATIARQLTRRGRRDLAREFWRLDNMRKAG